MAVVVREFIDFEAGKLLADADPYNSSGAVGTACSLVTSPAPPYGTWTLEITQHPTESFFRGPLFQYAASTTCITCAYIRLGSTNYPPFNPIEHMVTMIDENTNVFWQVRLIESGEFGLLEFKDKAGNVLDDWFLPFTDRWYRLEVLWQPGDASADWTWWLTEAGQARGAALGSGSAADFSAPGSDIGIFLRGEGGPLAEAPVVVFHGGCYVIEGATDIDDCVGNAVTGDWYSKGSVNGKITLNSATPDCDETGNAGAGDDVTGGTPSALWKYAGDDDLATDCVYTRGVGVASKGGGVRVAAPASDPFGAVVAAKWIWYGKGVFKAVYGSYNSGGDSYVVTNEIAGSFHPTNLRYYRKIADRRESAPNYDPMYDEQFVIGMFNWATTTKTARTTTFAEAWCSSLHAAIAPTNPSIGRFGRMWQNRVGRPL